MAGYYQGLLGAQERLAGLEQNRRRTGLLDLESQMKTQEFEDYQKNAPFRQALQQEQVKELQGRGPLRQLQAADIGQQMQGQQQQMQGRELEMLTKAKELFTSVGDQQTLDQANTQFEQFTGKPSPYRGKPFTPDFKSRVMNDLMTIGQRIQTQQLQQGRTPPGYRPTREGELEAIPGGPADIKAGVASEKTEKLGALAESRAAIVSKKVDQALEKIGAFGIFTTGATGKALGYVPGTKAYDLETILDTIKANVGFKELQAMRESSPTGGALGQIAVRELDFLQAAVASLDRGQSPAELKKNLAEVKQHFENWKGVMQQAGGPTYGRRGADKLKLNPDGSYTYQP